MVAKQPANLLTVCWIVRQRFERLSASRFAVGRAVWKDFCTCCQKSFDFCSFPMMGSCMISSQDVTSCSSSKKFQFLPFCFDLGTTGDETMEETWETSADCADSSWVCSRKVELKREAMTKVGR